MNTSSIEHKQWVKCFEQTLTQKICMMEVTDDRKEGDAHNDNKEEKVKTPAKEKFFKVIKNLKMNKALMVQMQLKGMPNKCT